MAKIRYIGNKDTKADNVANTGVVWAGKGDVQEVPDAAVEKLLAFPLVWELVSEAPGTKVAAQTKPSKATSKAKAKEEDEEPEPPRIDVDKTGKDKLEAYIRRHYGIEIDQRKSLTALRAEAKKIIAKNAATSPQRVRSR